jgi:hypothetical protein
VAFSYLSAQAFVTNRTDLLGKLIYDLVLATKLNRETEFSWIKKTPK